MNQAEQKTTVSETVRKHKEFLFSAVVVLLFGLFAFQLYFHAVRTSATTDESPHILAGYRYWQCGDFGINPEHPPLLKLLATIPLISKDLIQPSWECGSKPTSKFDSFQAGTIFLAKNNPENTVVPARLAASLMSLLLAALVFLAAREMFGRFEAVVALALLAFEPNIIAHGSLVTTDMTLTATIFATVYALYRYRKSPTVFRFLVIGTTVGLTLTAKHSGILILPILFLLLIADILLFRKMATEMHMGTLLLHHSAVFVGVVFIGVVLLWASYGFRYYALPNATQGIANLNGWRAVKAIIPESYTVGLADVVGTSSREMFLFGNVYPTGRWFYFPAAFSVKTSTALLILLALGLLTFKLYREDRREMLFLLLPALIFFVICLASKMNIGVRHILPVYPFFIVVAAAGVCVWIRKYSIVRYILIALLIFHATAAFRTAPNYLAFANDLWGGTNNTHRLLGDSNVEWGQNLKLVNEYLMRENINDCWIALHGNVELVRVYQPCRLMPGAWGWNFTEQLIEPVPPVIEGTILLSVSVLPSFNHEEYLPFANSEPIALIGGSVFVYRGRFEVPLVAALSRADRARQLILLNRFEEAIADGLQAVELAPAFCFSHFALGTAFASARQPDKARREFEMIIRLAQSNPQQFGFEEMRAQDALCRLQQ